MLKFQKLVQDVHHLQIILSVSDDQEFKLVEGYRKTVKDAVTTVQSKVEMNATCLEERRKLLQQFEETLETQVNMMKVSREEVTELQKKVSDIEKRLEKYRKQIEQNSDEMNQLMKEKESLMISDEGCESRKKANGLSEEAKFFAKTSCVRWDTSAQSHEIKGCIFEPHNTKCFSFDKREKSQFYICNRLWEMMDSSNEWKNLVTKESSKQKDAAPWNVTSVHMGDCEG